MKIILLGADGQLGSELIKIISKDEVIPLTIRELDICDFAKTSKILKLHSPGIIINATAYNKVEKAEEETEQAMMVNALAVKNIASICKEINCILVHFSTDYVFDGKKKVPYREDDIPCPLQSYGISKLIGEYFIKYILQKFFIIRTSGLYGKAGSKEKGMNFPQIILSKAKNNEEVKVVDDIKFSPTYAKDLAETSLQLIKTNSYGVYHITNRGWCSWYTFAKRISKITGISAKIKPIKYRQLDTTVMRPKYSVLSNHNLKMVGIKQPQLWFKALRDYLKEIGEIE